MIRIYGAMLASTLAVTPALAQFAPSPPELENRIPAPLPPPPQPPIINGPLGQSPPPVTYEPRQLNTSSDRATRCLHSGAASGLKGAKLDAYTRDCVNAD